ncbi:MAG: glycosyltransferase family 4 protein [Lentimicrobiaceae bacterium]|nr:glycosyltransferase family 4 protein [Lentimicrobiaceae bacterium]
MNEERKHIVFLARWYPHRYDPMFGLFVQRHAEAAALFNDITVVYCQQDNEATRQQVESQSRDASTIPMNNKQDIVDASMHYNKKNFEIIRTLENNVDTIRIYYKKPKNKILSLLRFYRANMIGLKLCKSPVDLIHVHILTRLGVIAWIQKLLHKTPYIITEHWSRYLPGNDFGGFIRKLATKIVVRNAELVTTVTDNLAKAMQNHGLKNDNYVVLPNVVNLDMFHISEKKNNTPCKIIHVSCFEDKSKNISGLLESLKIVEQKGIDFQCTLIGEGMDFDFMKAKAEELQLINKVSFTGLLEGQKLADELSSGDFLVLSSNYENMPVVILEALASGLPVVSTNVGGIKEMIDETKGILVEPRNKEALAGAIIKMIETHKDYDPNYLRKSVIERYGYESVGKFLDSIYNK